MAINQGPNVLGSSNQVFVDDELRRRVRTFLSALGQRKASERLGIGRATLDAARDVGGRLQRETMKHLVAALDREEPLVLQELAS